MKRVDQFGRRIYKNRICAALREYSEDFRYNKEWWIEKMGVGNNNEYLAIKFFNGDLLVIQSDYFDDTDKFPRINAKEISHVSRYYGDGIETVTTKDMVIDTDVVILFKDGVECKRYEMNEQEMSEMRNLIMNCEDSDPTEVQLAYCRGLLK